MTELNSSAAAIVEVMPQPRVKDILIAGLAGLIVPGAGQFVYGNPKRGSLYLLIFALLLALFWPLRLPQSPIGFVLLAFGMLALMLGAMLDAFYAKRPNSKRASAWWLFLALAMATAGWWAHTNIWVRAAGFRSFEVPSRSMEKTIDMGSHIVVDVRYYMRRSPAIGDVVVFRKDQLFIVKRVIAASGNTIEGRNGEVFVDGRKLSEPYVIREGPTHFDLDNFGPFTIPQNKLFVMGDNRNVSLDSRMPDYGAIDLKDIRGRALYVYGSRNDQNWNDLR